MTFSLNAVANNLSKITRPITIDDGNQRYQKINVTCNNVKELRAIHKADGQRLWCVAGANGKCSSMKVKAAKYACRGDVANDNDAVVQTKEVAPVKGVIKKQVQETDDRLALEAKLINIKQEELNRRRQAVEIQKRELNDINN